MSGLPAILAAPTKTCILKKATHNSGYALTGFLGHQLLAHRVVCILAHPAKDISKLQILHRCDVRNCINPKHLYAGTPMDNVRDMINRKRDRKACGEDKSIKLTWKDAMQIRRRYKFGRKFGNKKALAKEFGISGQMAYDIAMGKWWVRRR